MQNRRSGQGADSRVQPLSAGHAHSSRHNGLTAVSITPVSFTPIADVSHTGRARDPKVQVKDTVTSKDLVEGKDFTVAYANNVNRERQRQR